MMKIIKLYKWNIIQLLLVAIFVISLTSIVFARAGGGGGSGDSGDGGLIELIFWILISIPFPWNIVVIAIIIAFAYLTRKKTREASVLNKMPSLNNMGKAKGQDEFMSNNPGFNVSQFLLKVRIAFIQIQEAWYAKNLSKVRKYISDGVYQRFNTQFKMMDILQQTNFVSKIEIVKTEIDKYESDGNFDIIHVAIMAHIIDRYESKLYPQLNSGGEECFVEYWTFIRRKGIPEGDLFTTQNCPKCGSELPKNAGDVSRCDYCGTITNLGDYDWVLSEITQADDYVAQNPKLTKEGKMAEKIREIMHTDSNFSIQHIEDKASNGYLQILTAIALKNPTIMRRFVSDALFDKLSNEIQHRDYVFNRIFLNDVTLLAAFQAEQKYVLSIAIKSSYQRVKIQNGILQKLDETVVSKTEIIQMSRDISFNVNKGSLYAHSCPNCGAPVGDTIDINCSYCGAELNSTKNEWIITDIMEINDYIRYVEQNSESVIASVNAQKVDILFEVRDYAFNNLLIIMAADGKFEEQEKAYAEKVAKRWGYNINKIQPMFDMAKSGKLVIRMPENKKQRERIYQMMEKAAKIDGNVSEQELKLLNFIRKQYIEAA